MKHNWVKLSVVLGLIMGLPLNLHAQMLRDPNEQAGNTITQKPAASAGPSMLREPNLPANSSNIAHKAVKTKSGPVKKTRCRSGA